MKHKKWGVVYIVMSLAFLCIGIVLTLMYYDVYLLLIITAFTLRRVYRICSDRENNKFKVFHSNYLVPEYVSFSWAEMAIKIPELNEVYMQNSIPLFSPMDQKDIYIMVHRWANKNDLSIISIPHDIGIFVFVKQTNK
jgi:hypothetical protein